jgi:hypothetical protein
VASEKVGGEGLKSREGGVCRETSGWCIRESKLGGGMASRGLREEEGVRFE